MTPEQARDLRSEIEAANREAKALTSGMDAAALMRRPADGGWSVGENLQHLILTADAMLPLAEKAVADLERAGRNSGRSASLGFFGWLLVKSQEPPPRMRSRTISPFEPAPVEDPIGLPRRLEEAHAKVAALIARATGLSTGAIKVSSPFNARIRYNVYAAFRIVLAHTRRHLWQAAAVKAGSRSGTAG